MVGAKGAFGGISNLSQYKWVAAKWKGNDADVLKGLWKQIFSNTDASKGVTKTDIFNAMTPNLKMSLFGTKQSNQFQIFEAMTQDTNSILYQFIKVE